MSNTRFFKGHSAPKSVVNQLFSLFGGLWLFMFCSGASAQDQYCYQWGGLSSCYPTKDQAKAAMFAVMPTSYPSRTIEKAPIVESVHWTGRMNMRTEFEVQNSEPERVSPPGYTTGRGPDQGNCASAGIAERPELCVDGDISATNFLQYFMGVYPQCTFVNKGFSRNYKTPFLSIFQWNNNYRSSVGHVTFGSYTEADPFTRRLDYSISCPGWVPPDPQDRAILIAKEQFFYCPVEYVPIVGKDPQVSKFECQPRVRTGYIRFTLRQTKTPEANCNPCHPATGDKSRNEQDFDGGALSFVRYYHSLSQVNTVPYFAAGWTHSFSDRVMVAGSALMLISAEGYSETFQSLGNGDYRSAQNSRSMLRKLADGSYQYFTESGVVDSFNNDGRLVKRQYSRGSLSELTMTYVGNALTTVKDQNGRTLTLRYSNSLPAILTSGQLSGLTLPDGQSISYAFDSFLNLQTVTYPGGLVKTYHYNEDGQLGLGRTNALTGISNEDGKRYAKFGYDGAGRAIKSELYASPTQLLLSAAINYANPDQPIVSLPTGEVKTYTIVTEGSYRRVTKIQSTNGSDANVFASGALTQSTDRKGVVTQYQYSNGYQSAVIEAVGTPQERKTVFVRDSNYALLSSELQRKSGSNYLPVKRHSYTYNARGQQLTQTITDLATSPNVSRVSTYSYCEQEDVNAGVCPLVGLLKSIDGQRNDVADTTTYSYRKSDAADLSYRKGDFWRMTNALGQSSEVLKYDGAGRVLSMVDSNNVVTDLEYTPRGWLSARKLRGSNNAVETDDQITRFEYWPTALVKKVTQADGSFVSFAYDDAKRLIGIADNSGSSMSYTLDAAGNRTKEDSKDPSGVLKRTLSRTYNSLGQLQTLTDALGRNTNYTYDANGIADQSTDSLARTSDQDVDPLRRLSRSLQDVTGVAAESKFSYDALDNLTQVTDPKALNTNYSYNGFSELTQLVSPDTGTTTYGYDSAGNRTRQTDARGVTTNYGFDALNRLTSVSYPNSSLNVGYLYDMEASGDCGAVGESFLVGRLVQITDGSGSTQYCYDRFGNLTRKIQSTNGRKFVVRYLYASNGRMTGMVYPDGASVSYSFDTLGRITGINAKNAAGTTQSLISTVSYLPFGPPQSWSYGSGSSARLMQRSYNQNYQPVAIKVSTAANVLANGGLDLGYAFDAVGNLNRLHAANLVDPAKRVFSYDGLNRLTQAQNGANNALLESYAYDRTGNRTSATVAGTTNAYTYPTTSHRLSQVGSGARSYDANGNATQISAAVVKNFVYNDQNRLSEYKEGTVLKQSYIYNGKGEQVHKFLDTTNTYSVHDEMGHWLGDYNSTGVAIQQAIWFGDLPVGLWTDASTAQKLHYLEPDMLGTPRVVVDPSRGTNGTAVWTWDLNSEAFGNTDPNQNPDGDATNFVFNMRFPGQRFDSVSGLNYNYFRDYEPGTGRYAQSDPIGLRGGMSTFGYVGGNPVLNFDPFGLWSLTWGLFVPTQYIVGPGGQIVIAGGTGTSHWPGGPDWLRIPYFTVESISFRGGIGLGGGISLDPSGGKPDPNACPWDNGLGVYADANATWGFIGAGFISRYGGTQHIGEDGVRWTEYSSFMKPKAKFPLRYGFGISGSAGIELTHYFPWAQGDESNACGCK